MSLFFLAVLAVVQGITEFLPISSSAHLVLLHELGGTTEGDLALDVAMHLGSIAAVILYFRRDSLAAFAGLAHLARGRTDSREGRLAGLLIIATLPAVLFGGLIALMNWEEALRNATVIGWTMIVFGVALWWIDARAPESRRAEAWTVRRALIMGLWQAVALIPGVSRSGITITTARALGFERHDAARLSMLMSIPVTLATGAVLALEVTEAGFPPGMLGQTALATLMAFAAAYGALALMMRFLSRVSFTPYVIYRVILGIVLLALAYGPAGAGS